MGIEVRESSIYKETQMNAPRIHHRAVVVKSYLNRRMINNDALRLIPHATYSEKAKYEDDQAIVFYKMYCFQTGDNPFWIAHKFAVMIKYHMLDLNEMIPEVEGHHNPVGLPYYQDEYFFFEDSPFVK